jgi:hypothetical protein
VSKQSIIVGVVLLVFAGICFVISGRSAGPQPSGVASKSESSQKSQSSSGPGEIQASAGVENTAAGFRGTQWDTLQAKMRVCMNIAAATQYPG